MRSHRSAGRRHRPPIARSAALVIVLGLSVVACGDGGGEVTSSGTGPAATEADGPPAARTPEGERGRELVVLTGCTTCHSTDGSRGVGPTWRGAAGSEVTLSDGTELIADRDFLRRAIADPKAQVRDGYADVMPTYSALTEDDIEAIVTYLEEIA